MLFIDFSIHSCILSIVLNSRERATQWRQINTAICPLIHIQTTHSGKQSIWCIAGVKK
jgi:hypothetical protein